MKKLLLPIAIATAITSLTACHLDDHGESGHTHSHKHDKHHDGHDKKHKDKDGKHKHDEHADTEGHDANKNHDAKHNGNQEGQDHAQFADFDWAGIPKTTALAGLTGAGIASQFIPENMKVYKQPSDIDSQFTSQQNAVDLKLFDGNETKLAKGDLTYYKVIMSESNQAFDQAKFDTDIAKKMADLQAKEIYSGDITPETLETLKQIEGISNGDYMTGNVNNIRQYAVQGEDGSQVIYQITSDKQFGEIGELKVANGANAADTSATDNAQLAEADAESTEQAEQTTSEPAVETPKSDELKSQIDASGKAVLNLNFDTGKASVKSDNQVIVDEIYALLNDNPELKVSIEGHTDDVGNAKYNQQLSQQRAETVKNTLVQRGIDGNRLKTQGFGESKPMVDNSSMNNRAKNRRVELVKF